MTNRIPIVLAAIAALAIPVMTADTYVIQLLNIAMLNAIVVLGLNFATGWTGQINFGQAAFYGLGAYATAIAAKAGLPWIFTPVRSRTASSCLASSMFKAIGFSHRTCLPASAALMVQGTCRWFGSGL